MISAIRLLALVLLSFVIASAQGSKPKPSPTPTPEPKAEDQVRVFIEEVRLPVAATDTYGHYDPTLRTDDILVLEDGVTQQIRSIQQLPVNVLLLLDTGNQLGLKNTNTTRDIALRVVSDLRAGNRIAVMQFTDRPELLQPWTADKVVATMALKTKLHSGKTSRLSEAIAAAAD